VRDGRVVTPIGTPRRAADVPLPGQLLPIIPAAAASPASAAVPPQRVAAVSPAKR
jgi:penicillin-binding protein 2